MSTFKSSRTSISRKDIIERALEDSAALILFIAPAGFGKTSTMVQLQQALQARGMQTAWWSLDRQDNDPQRLFTFLRKVFSQTDGASQIAPFGLNVPSAKPLAIFLDDFETVDGGPLTSIVLSLLEQLPLGSRLVIGSRRKLSAGLTKLKLEGAVLSFQEQDLQFSKEQSAQLLQTAMGQHPLPLATVNLLHEKTAGWPAAVALASLALGQKEHGDTGLVDRISATLQPVEEYLSEVVLINQPQEIHEFLLSTSVLHQLDPELCQTMVPGLNGDFMIERLIESNLFVTPVPGQTNRWRYHPLFANILRSRLKRKRPAEFQRLHLAAAGWYEAKAQIVPAIDHIVAGEDYPYAARLLAHHAMQLLVDGRINLLARWFQLFPEEVLQEHLALMTVRLWVTTFTQGAHHAIQQCESMAPHWPGSDVSAHVHLTALRCSWQFMLDRPTQAGELGLKALSRMPTLEPYADNVLNISMAIYFVQEGNRTAANRLLNAARERQGSTAFMRMFIESAESEQDMQDGRVKQAMARLRIAVGATHSNSGGFDITNGNAWAGVLYGVACYEAGQWAQAKRLLSAYVPVAKAVGSHDHLILAMICLSRIAHAQGDADEAIQYLADLEHIGASRQLPRLMASAWLERSRTQILAGHSVEANASLERANLPGVWNHDRPLRRLAHSSLDPQTGQLRWALHFGDPHQALSDIDAALADCHHIQWALRGLTLELMRAAALSKCNQESSALDQLHSTLCFMAEQGMVSRALDEGPMVMALVQKLQMRERHRGTQSILTEHIDRLLESGQYLNISLATSASISDKTTHLTSLTPKETRILTLLTEGYSNQALSSALQVSESTIRTHLRNINAKLDVKSRMQAVARARQLGWLK